MARFLDVLPEDIPLVQRKKIVATVTESIIGSLLSGVPVEIYGLGNFKLVDRKARLMFNNKLKKKVEIPARKGLSFHFSSVLKKNLNK